MSWFSNQTPSPLVPTNQSSQLTQKGGVQTKVSVKGIDEKKEAETSLSSDNSTDLPSLNTPSSESSKLSSPVTFAVRARKAGRSARLLDDGTTFSDGLPPRISLPRPNQVFRIRDTLGVTTLTSSNSVATFSASNFTVSVMGQLGGLQAIFDQYRIEEVEAWITPRVNELPAGSNVGLMVSAVDYDDSTTPGSFQALLDYENAVCTSGAVGHYRRWRPHAALAAYSGAFTSYANVESPWIDAASTSVQHFGLKTAWTVTDVAYTYDVIVRLHTAWRNAR